MAAAGACLAAQGHATRIRKVFIQPDSARHGPGSRLATAAERRSGRSRFMLRAHLDPMPPYRRLGYVEEKDDRMEVAGGLSMCVVFLAKG